MNKEIYIEYKVKYQKGKTDQFSFNSENIGGFTNLASLGNISFSSFVDNFKKEILWDTGDNVESIKCFFWEINNSYKRNHPLIKSAARWKGRKYYGGNVLTRYWKWLLNK